MERIETAPVRGFLHRPETPNGKSIALTHGAGSDCSSPLLLRMSEEFAAHGWLALRFDLAYRQARKSGPPPFGSAAGDRASIELAVQFLREEQVDHLVLGGHSYGGRQSSMLAAEQPGLVDALLLLSYPLHPPLKREQIRTGHFPSLRTPALFLHGSRDPFGSAAEMEAALALIPAPTTLSIVDGSGHDLAHGAFDFEAGVLQRLHR